MNDLVGKKVKLLVPVRSSNGKEYFKEHPKITRIIDNLDRHMFCVVFEDGASTFLFPNEIEVLEEE